MSGDFICLPFSTMRTYRCGMVGPISMGARGYNSNYKLP